MDLQRPAWTLSEAVERTTASRSTLRRHLENDRLPNAYKDTSGAWRFPIEDLLAVGVGMVKSKPDAPVSTLPEQVHEQPVNNHERRILDLEHQLAVERERSAGLERLAQQAQAHAEGLQMALRMIEGTKHERPTEQTQSVPTEQAQVVAVNEPVAAPQGRLQRLLSFGVRRS